MAYTLINAFKKNASFRQQFVRDTVLIAILAIVCVMTIFAVYRLNELSQEESSARERAEVLQAWSSRIDDNITRLQYVQLRSMSILKQNQNMTPDQANAWLDVHRGEGSNFSQALSNIADALKGLKAVATSETIAESTENVRLAILDFSRNDYAWLGALGYMPNTVANPELAKRLEQDALQDRRSILEGANSSLQFRVQGDAQHYAYQFTEARKQQLVLLLIAMVVAILLCALLFFALRNTLKNNAKLMRELRRNAKYDALTGAYNRSSLDDKVLHEFAQSRRLRQPLSIILLDLDFFKRYNDLFGHPEGDALLVECVNAWRSMARGGDFIARMGGEEFAVVLPNCDANQAVEVALRYLSAMPAGQTFSAGVSEWRKGESFLEWYKRADKRLYIAKFSGRNQVRHTDVIDAAEDMVELSPDAIELGATAASASRMNDLEDKV